MKTEIYYNKNNNTKLEIWNANGDWDFDTTQELCKNYNLSEISEADFEELMQKNDFYGFVIEDENEETVLEEWSIPSKYLRSILENFLLNSFDCYADKNGKKLSEALKDK
ncbi:hypothetical protein [Campylobacter sp. JMF_03 NE3]|uniref:hypothetical protein n=1 Tax=Campylobacter sp. JMF_03 NE3 TaxID=2983831 RepID=UPI0022E9A240|nr:hypothetical protein [Campylobacter sp. JMF_03 NE3]MDA3053561.1 hypothetical protein [Campylobacter sp. JMF_03 NE3]